MDLIHALASAFSNAPFKGNEVSVTGGHFLKETTDKGQTEIQGQGVRFRFVKPVLDDRVRLFVEGTDDAVHGRVANGLSPDKLDLPSRSLTVGFDGTIGKTLVGASSTKGDARVDFASADVFSSLYGATVPTVSVDLPLDSDTLSLGYATAGWQLQAGQRRSHGDLTGSLPSKDLSRRTTLPLAGLPDTRSLTATRTWAKGEVSATVTDGRVSKTAPFGPNTLATSDGEAHSLGLTYRAGDHVFRFMQGRYEGQAHGALLGSLLGVGIPNATALEYRDSLTADLLSFIYQVPVRVRGGVASLTAGHTTLNGGVDAFYSADALFFHSDDTVSYRLRDYRYFSLTFDYQAKTRVAPFVSVTQIIPYHNGSGSGSAKPNPSGTGGGGHGFVYGGLSLTVGIRWN